MFNINLFQGALKFGGARNSLFQVTISNPVNSLGDIFVPLLCKAASLPASTLGQVTLNYFGRPVKFAGNRTFNDWTVTILNDEDFLIRNALEEWSNSINTHEGNAREFSSASPVLYKSSAQVVQFSKTKTPLRVYDFVGLWPSSIDQIEMSWDNPDQIQEYQVTFTYDYWKVSGGITGLAGQGAGASISEVLVVN